VETVRFLGNEGLLQGHYHLADFPRVPPVVALFLSGAHEPIENVSLEMAANYRRNGVDVLAVNYRGFGNSPGTPTEKGLYSDAGAMLDYLTDKKNIPASQIIVHGHGLGASVAANLAKSGRKKLCGLVLEHPTPSIKKRFTGDEARWGWVTGRILSQLRGAFSVHGNLKRAALSGMKIVMLNSAEEQDVKIDSLRSQLIKEGFDVGPRRPPAFVDDREKLTHSHFFQEISNAFLAPVLPPVPVLPAASSHFDVNEMWEQVTQALDTRPFAGTK
jgi:RTX toxin RtxA